MTISARYPIAKDENGQWIEISEAQHGLNYYCPECSSPFVARLGSIRAHHFAHQPGYSGECTGESGYHHLAKHLLAYHFEKVGQILLLAKCTICARVFSQPKKIINIKVEKGSDGYRPDIKLFLAGNVLVDGEVVYKNPLGDKFNAYKEKKANLLVWKITGQVSQVPSPRQYFWEEDYDSLPLYYEGHGFRNELLLLASPVAPDHICSPYGVAYISEMDCWKCHKKTRLAFLSSWYPMWGDLNRLGYDGGGDFHFYSYIPIDMIPAGFWRNLNKQYGTNLREDFSWTASQKYLMNHCSMCGAKQGDHYLIHLGLDALDALDEMTLMMEEDERTIVGRVTIDFSLTEWEKDTLIKRPLMQSITEWLHSH